MAVAADHSGPGRRRQPMIHPMTDPPVTAAEPELPAFAFFARRLEIFAQIRRAVSATAPAAWHQHSPQQAVAALFPEHVRYAPRSRRDQRRMVGLRAVFSS